MNQKKNMSSVLVWMDLEMTGLDHERETILEVAVIVTDLNLKILEVGPNIVIHQPNAILEKMDDWCIQTHGKSGLIEKVKNSTISMQQAEELICNFIAKHCTAQTAPLCGNSIWFDKLFLKKYMPRVVDYLHYRTVDVTSFKVMLSAWTGQQNAGFRKKNSHRALDDIKESIAELAFYRAHFFKI